MDITDEQQPQFMAEEIESQQEVPSANNNNDQEEGYQHKTQQQQLIQHFNIFSMENCGDHETVPQMIRRIVYTELWTRALQKSLCIFVEKRLRTAPVEEKLELCTILLELSEWKFDDDWKFDIKWNVDEWRTAAHQPMPTTTNNNNELMAANNDDWTREEPLSDEDEERIFGANLPEYEWSFDIKWPTQQ